MSIHRRVKTLLGVVVVALATTGVIVATPAAAAPKPAEITITATPVGYPSTGPCGLWLAVDYTGGKGKYTLTARLTWLDDDVELRPEPPLVRSIRRSAAPATLVRTSAPSGSNLGAERVGVEATLSDRKGIVATFNNTFELLSDCP